LVQELMKDTSSDRLLAALESNMVAFWSVYGRADGCTLRATPDVVWFYTGIQVPLFNGVLSANLRPDGVQAICGDIQAKIEEQGAAAFWWVGPRSKPKNLGSLLERCGAESAGEVPGMAMELASLDDKPEPITGFTIEKIGNLEMRALWARIAAVGTGFPDVAADAMVRLEATLTGPLYEAQQRYIGFLSGNPVATSALVLDSGVAGIYAVATLPEARRKGIGRLMTVTPLREARQLGYRVGILQSSSMGHSIYKAIGFKDACRHRLYLQS
jgi:GNAT superfamily N-acetyltransferase